MYPINNFTVLESVYGRFIVNRYCSLQADYLIKTGFPHIQPELAILLNLIRTFPEKCIIVDAGANIGLVSIPLALEIKDRGGVVHAFEPQRMIYNALCGAIVLNDLENVFTYNKALGAFASHEWIEKPDYNIPQDFGLVSLADDKKSEVTELIEVVTIDSLCLSRLDFLKIDVEGMELDVLEGGMDTIKKYRPWCWIEYWKVGADKIKDKFVGLDYMVGLMDNLNMLCFPQEKYDSNIFDTTGGNKE